MTSKFPVGHRPLKAAWHLLAIAFLSVIAAKILIMTGLHLWPVESSVLAHVIDVVLLAVVLPPIAYFFLFRPLTNLQEKLSINESDVKSIFINSIDSILVVDKYGVILYVNKPGLNLLNRTENRLLGQEFGYPIKNNMASQIDLVHKDGSIKIVEMHPIPFHWETKEATLIILHDITDSEALKTRLEELSLIDELTRLQNRRGFFALAEQLIKQTNRSGKLFIYFLDLNGMKLINDKYGHSEGDQALIDTAGILTHTFRDSDIIGRLGGDEFTVAINLDEGHEVKDLSDRLEANIARYNQQRNHPYQLSLSYGVVSYNPESPCSLENMLVEADELMYQDKLARKENRA